MPAAAKAAPVTVPISESSRTAAFFAATFAITWTLQLPAALSKLGLLGSNRQQYAALVGLGLFGPLIGAILAARRESGAGGVRALFAQLGRWRAAPHWYAVALLLPGALLALGVLIADPSGRRPFVYPPTQGPRIAALLLIPFLEEIGWRGFALPRLIATRGPLRASVVLGLLWALWHLPMFVLQRFDAAMIALSLPFFVAGSIVFTWLYLRPRAGLPVAVVAHAGAHLSNSHASLPDDILPLVVHTVGFCVCAALLVALDPSTWRRVDPQTARGTR